nr:hypothetical protein [Burkholderia cenocepacia]
MKEVAPYVLTGALAVQDDLEDEQLDRVSRHLGGIATVYAKHDKIAHTVALRISGTLVRDDVRYIEQRVERFAEENARVAAILISEWNGVTSELVVGMNWDAQCLLRLGAAQEQLGKLGLSLISCSRHMILPRRTYASQTENPTGRTTGDSR